MIDPHELMEAMNSVARGALIPKNRKRVEFCLDQMKRHVRRVEAILAKQTPPEDLAKQRENFGQDQERGPRQCEMSS